MSAPPLINDASLSVLTACPAGRFGPDCAGTAACGEGAPNDPVSGRCLCGPGRRGEDCGHGETPQTPVNTSDIRCVSVGLIPDCPPGWFGLSCLHRCNCSNGDKCDAATGNCSCGLGRTGARCDEGEAKSPLFVVAARCHTQDLLLLLHAELFGFFGLRMSCRHVWSQLSARMRLSAQQHL